LSNSSIVLKVGLAATATWKGDVDQSDASVASWPGALLRMPVLVNACASSSGGWVGHRARLPLACLDWANTKAAYRFFSNDRVSEDQILAGRFHSTRDRFTAAEGTVLVVQDTTEFTYGASAPKRSDYGLLVSRSAPSPVCGREQASGGRQEGEHK
jgi:hypothetical protein